MFLTAGAPPTSAILEKMDNLGFEVMHVYGLTETYGHVLQCAWNEEWNDRSNSEKADLNSRQGVRYPNLGRSHGCRSRNIYSCSKRWKNDG